jgi:hypothetical protein
MDHYHEIDQIARTLDLYISIDILVSEIDYSISNVESNTSFDALDLGDWS